MLTFNMKKNNSKKTIKLGVYLALLTSLLIVVAVLLFAIYTSLSVKDIASEYESQIAELRQLISRMVLQSLTVDSGKHEYSTTKAIINLLKTDDMLAYAYIEDNTTNKIVFLDSDKKKTSTYNAKYNIDSIDPLEYNLSDTYTLYLGVPKSYTYEEYLDKSFKSLLIVLPVFILIGTLIAIIVASIISKPITKLSLAAKKISNGNFDAKLENTNFEEINDLIFSYNEMIFQLNELYQSLELKVQERTIALETANYKLKETQAMMVHSEKMRSLGELVAGIAHEINNPVNFIHGNIMILQNYTEDLLKLIDLYEENNSYFPDEIKTKISALRKQIDIDFLRDDIKDLIRSCIEGTERTKNIVLDLKNFSRMEEMVISQIDIPKEIDTTLNILNNKYKNRITVIKNYAPDLPKIEAYGGQLNQVFMNILDNAQDAMGESGTLTINLSKLNDKVKLEFIDTGSGIPEENLKKVFDPFFTTKPVGKGTGLGMSISYRVISDHKGTINVDSVVGKGTKFTIILPINQSTPKIESPEENSNDTSEEQEKM